MAVLYAVTNLASDFESSSIRANSKLMRTHYLTIWQIRGFSELSGITDGVVFASQSEPNAIAKITTNPEPYFEHIDRWRAIANRLLYGLFRKDGDETPECKIAKSMDEARERRLSERQQTGIYLVIEGHIDIDDPLVAENRRDLDGFSLVIDAIDSSKASELFREFTETCMAGLIMSLPHNAEHQINKIGATVYITEVEGGDPVYSFTFEVGSPRLSVAAPLTSAQLHDAIRRAGGLIEDECAARSVSLLKSALDPNANKLEGFVAAWSALEIFVNKGFAVRYHQAWIRIMRAAAPAEAGPVFDRIQDVLSSRYRLLDRFMIITAILSPETFEADTAEFKRLKKVRDNLFHGSGRSERLPTDATVRLVTKVLRSHADQLVVARPQTNRWAPFSKISRALSDLWTKFKRAT